MTEGIATPGAGWRRADGWVGKKGGKGRRSGRRAVGEIAMVDDVEFTSYYGRPVIKAPVWKSPDVPLYLFLGGAAGTSSILGAMADLSGRPTLARVSRLVAGGGSIASVAFLVHDLGRPERFLHMLRVFKPTSALSVDTYILSPFSAAAGATAAVELLGWFPRLKRFGGIVSALFGGPMATYTAVLLANTAVPSWRAYHEKLPFVFAGLGDGRRWRDLHDLHARGRSRSGAEDGGDRGGDRAGRGAQGRERPRHRQRAVPRGPRG